MTWPSSTALRTSSGVSGISGARTGNSYVLGHLEKPVSTGRTTPLKGRRALLLAPPAGGTGDRIAGGSQGDNGKLREGVQLQGAGEYLAEKYNVVIARDQGSPDEDHDRHNGQFHFKSPTKTISAQ